MTDPHARRDAGPCGVLLLDKPRGFTSHDAVARTRRALNTRAVGHAGTLDPLATGLLIVLVGDATRLAEYVLGHDKAYHALLQLGVRTNTDDAEGQPTQTRAVPADALARAQQALPQFLGAISQVPPQFSAISKGGQRAYVLARKGEHVELEARNVRIDALSVTAVEGVADQLALEVTCGSGTYIRSLARDLGERIGCGAHLAALRRTRIGPFAVGAAVAPDAISSAALRPADEALPHFEAVRLEGAVLARYLQGQFVPLADAPRGPARVYDPAGRFLGVGIWDAARRAFKPEKVFASAAS